MASSDEVNIIVPPKKRPRKKPDPKIMFLSQDERELLDWYRENELLYNPQHQDFKDKSKKQRIMDEKAQELANASPERYAGHNGERLGRFIASLRSAYSRLRTKKSGSGANKFTQNIFTCTLSAAEKNVKVYNIDPLICWSHYLPSLN